MLIKYNKLTIHSNLNVAWYMYGNQMSKWNAPLFEGNRKIFNSKSNAMTSAQWTLDIDTPAVRKNITFEIPKFYCGYLLWTSRVGFYWFDSLKFFIAWEGVCKVNLISSPTCIKGYSNVNAFYLTHALELRYFFPFRNTK